MSISPSKNLSWLRTLPGSPLIVAEIKMASPYGYRNPLPWRDQLSICESVGDIISVHTDPLWGGSWAHLYGVRQATSKPILAKGFHPTVAHVKQALKLLRDGDSVLTVGWHPDGELGDRCWFEAETLSQLDPNSISKVVWNARNPRTGERRGVSVASARGFRKGWLCQASLIKGPEDVVPGMDAVLIGEGLYT